ncbi:hypothetical protein DN752_12480 [Echinicola strongylocentroti]|uniref:Uncharacterized protein n=1 Tax=Echinicola strongylocentroti TaxID=1795355 RepID=A0A2Z4IJI7_9BACT|nr:hypothetical protein [Echinicola strongylocentroti]AWW30877.1 hypothetical protein DN752_12480 [Echinicola strongylocentroti]
MKNTLLIWFFLLLLLASCTPRHQEKETFSTELGAEKMQALSMLINSYGRFLEVHYADFSSQREKTRHFIEDVFRQRPIAVIKQMPGIPETLQAMESSGLRKDIYIYEHEEDNYTKYPVKQLMPSNFPDYSLSSQQVRSKVPSHNPPLFSSPSPVAISKKTALTFNKDGLFMYALATAKQEDGAYMDYMKLRYKTSNIHPYFSAERFLDNQQDNAPLWFEELSIIIDIYYKLLLTDERTLDGGLMS